MEQWLHRDNHLAPADTSWAEHSPSHRSWPPSPCSSQIHFSTFTLTQQPTVFLNSGTRPTRSQCDCIGWITFRFRLKEGQRKVQYHTNVWSMPRCYNYTHWRMYYDKIYQASLGLSIESIWIRCELQGYFWVILPRPEIGKSQIVGH